MRWLCEVVRVLDALDEEKTEAYYKWYGRQLIGVADNGTKIYRLVGTEALFFKETVVGGHHIFRVQYSPATVICDEEIRQACKSAQLTGISFDVIP